MSARAPQDAVIKFAGAAGSTPERMYGLDWLRAVSAILVVMLHAAMPYLTHPMPGLVWSTESEHRSAAVNLIAWWIDGFIMPVFFLMSGFFAARLFQQRGANAFLKHRLSRLGLPFLFAFVCILPLDLYAWLLGWVNSGLIPLQKLSSLNVKGPLGEALWGVSHLWFLQYMLVYCTTAWAISRLTESPLIENQLSRLWSLRPHGMSWLAAGMGTLVAGSVLWLQPRIVIGFRHNWIPFWENLVYYAVPFVLGWTWHHSDQSAAPVRGNSVIRMLAALVVFILLWPRLLTHLESEAIPATDPLVPFLFAGFAILMATSAFGLAQSLKSQTIAPPIAYLSKASFWIYLLHHPLTGLVHDDLALVQWPPMIEFLFTNVIVLTVCLLTFEVLVRRTWVGSLLNGYREPSPAARTQPPFTEAPAQRKAA